jgi:hypothetical protein
MALEASGMGKAFSDEAITATMAASDAQGKATAALTSKGSLEAQAANIIATQATCTPLPQFWRWASRANVNDAAIGRANARTAAANTQVNAQAVAGGLLFHTGGQSLVNAYPTEV